MFCTRSRVPTPAAYVALALAALLLGTSSLLHRIACGVFPAAAREGHEQAQGEQNDSCPVHCYLLFNENAVLRG